jgi:outer membrane protein assembly factor BamB
MSSSVRRTCKRCRCPVLAAALVGVVCAADWPMPGGNPQRNGWAASERQITKVNVSTLKLLYKYQTDNQSRGTNSLTTPIISGNLITYRGFKEMLMFAGSSDKVFGVDADLNQLIWETNLPFAAIKPAAKPLTESCPGGLTSPVVMAGSSSNSLHFAALASRAPAATGVSSTHPNPYLPPLYQSVYPLLPTTLTQLNAVYMVSSDGYLHILNSSTGQDLIPSVRFVLPNAKITSLNLRDNVVYATTADNCDGYQNALLAIDILSPTKSVRSFIPRQGGFAGTVGTAIGNDGTVYVQVAYPKSNDAKRCYETVLALTPKELKVKDYFTIGDKPLKPGTATSGVTPVVFSFPGRDLVIAGGRDGKIYLLDSRSLGGLDHHTPLFATPELAERPKNIQGNGFRGVFSTWFDVDTETRRFYTTVFGPLRKSSGVSTHRATDAGSVVALELAGTPEQPALKTIWVSGPLVSPAPAVIANGLVFVLSNAGTQLASGATLHALDAITGKDLYSSAVSASTAPSGGLALANGRIYFAGRDNAVYCYGMPAEQKQLIEQ